MPPSRDFYLMIKPPPSELSEITRHKQVLGIEDGYDPARLHITVDPLGSEKEWPDPRIDWLNAILTRFLADPFYIEFDRIEENTLRGGGEALARDAGVPSLADPPPRPVRADPANSSLQSACDAGLRARLGSPRHDRPDRLDGGRAPADQERRRPPRPVWTLVANPAPTQPSTLLVNSGRPIPVRAEPVEALPFLPQKCSPSTGSGRTGRK